MSVNPHHHDMMGVLHSRVPAAGTLQRRRIIDRCRRLAAALLAGLTSFAILQYVSGLVITRPIVVAAKVISRGDTIRSEQLRTITVPEVAVLHGMMSTINDVEGHIARIRIPLGAPLLASAVSQHPTVPDGYTVIDVRLSGGWREVIESDTVSLSASGPCNTGTESLTAPMTSGQPPMPTCIIAHHAIVMGTALDDESGTAVTPLAMPAEEALHVLSIQEHGMIVAVGQGNSTNTPSSPANH